MIAHLPFLERLRDLGRAGAGWRAEHGAKVGHACSVDLRARANARRVEFATGPEFWRPVSLAEPVFQVKALASCSRRSSTMEIFDYDNIPCCPRCRVESRSECDPR